MQYKEIEEPLNELRKFKIEALQWIEAIQNEINKTDDKIKKILASVNTEGETLNLRRTRHESNNFKRKPKTSWKKIVVKKLSEINHIMTSNELLKEIYPDISIEDKQEYAALFSSALYKLCKQNVLGKYYETSSEAYYGLYEWFNLPEGPFDDPQLKKEFLIKT